MSKPRNMYRLLANKRDPRIMLVVPKEINKDLLKMADHNGRTRSAEIIARLAATLTLNDEFMATDRLMRLINCKKLAWRPTNGKSSQHHGAVNDSFSYLSLKSKYLIAA